MMIGFCFSGLSPLVQTQRELEQTEANLNILFLRFRGGEAQRTVGVVDGTGLICGESVSGAVSSLQIFNLRMSQIP